MCATVLLFVLAICFSEWQIEDLYSTDSSIRPGRSYSSGDLGRRHLGERLNRKFVSNSFWGEGNARHLEEDNNNNNSQASASNGDFSSYRCDDIFKNTVNPKNDDHSNGSTQRCLYAQTCEGEGVALPVVFCQTSILSTTAWLVILSPFLLLGLTLLFRLLGSTADEYFSPSLEMFSVKLGLPPRFAGVTLLALGNGAADVSATINAIASDPENGYLMSLGALTGAAMFITTVVVGAVVVANGGVVCRGALVRDVMALGVTVVVVALNLEKGEVGPGVSVGGWLDVLNVNVIMRHLTTSPPYNHLQTEKTFISIYIGFVCIVLVADVYHRAVMLPRLRHEIELREHERQLEAERVASMRAGDAFNSFVGDSGAKSVGGEIPDVVKSGTYDFRNPSMSGGGDDARTHVSAPYRLEDNNPSVIGNRALNAVLTALSNYNEDENMDENDMDSTRRNGWGIESTVEGSKSWDRPVVLHGADGVLTKHHHHHRQHADGENEDQFHSPYSVMEDMDVVDRMCLQDGSLGLPAYNWSGAFQDFKHELMVHFRKCWRDIFDDEESNRLEKFLLVCEYPMTVLRKVRCVVVYFVLMHLFCVNTDHSQ